MKQIVPFVALAAALVIAWSAAVTEFMSASNGISFGIEGVSDTTSCRVDYPLAMLHQLRGVCFDRDDEHGGCHDVGMITEEVGVVPADIVQFESAGRSVDRVII